MVLHTSDVIILYDIPTDELGENAGRDKFHLIMGISYDLISAAKLYLSASN